LNAAETVAELNLLDDLGQAVLSVEFAPFPLRPYHQLERHGQTGRAAEGTKNGCFAFAHSFAAYLNIQPAE
jgi:hypothetical protein